MIDLENVTKNFGAVTAVHQISLQVADGEIFGLVGPDGAGKTTAIRMMLGLMDPDGGRVNVLGRESIEDVKNHIGYVPQKFSLYGDLTVMENIALFASLYGAGKREINKLAGEILAFTRLLPFKDRLAAHLSGGMKQKLALAAGLIHKPRLLLLDEPTTGVDPVSRREFWQMLYRLNKDGMTILVSTPYMDEAELCHRVAFMNDGGIISCAAPQQLCASYPHKVLELTMAGKNVKPYLADCDILDMNSFGGSYHIVVGDAKKGADQVKAALLKAGLSGFDLREITPTLEDVFVAFAGEVA